MEKSAVSNYHRGYYRLLRQGFEVQPCHLHWSGVDSEKNSYAASVVHDRAEILKPGAGQLFINDFLMPEKVTVSHGFQGIYKSLHLCCSDLHILLLFLLHLRVDATVRDCAQKEEMLYLTGRFRGPVVYVLMHDSRLHWE